jgi:hypothetical protein
MRLYVFLVFQNQRHIHPWKVLPLNFTGFSPAIITCYCLAKQLSFELRVLRGLSYFKTPGYSFLKNDMELVERAGFLEQLQKKAAAVTDGEGHCVFISGEAGIGKKSFL